MTSVVVVVDGGGGHVAPHWHWPSVRLAVFAVVSCHAGVPHRRLVSDSCGWQASQHRARGGGTVCW